jgi:hypothetical protein
MQTRNIAITVGAAIAAFAVAFGVAKATGGSENKASAAAPTAKSIDVQTATISANVQTAGLPALKPKPKPKAKSEPTPDAQQATPTPTPSATTPSTTTTTPSTSTSTTSPPADTSEQPVHGGGEH